MSRIMLFLTSYFQLDKRLLKYGSVSVLFGPYKPPYRNTSNKGALANDTFQAAGHTTAVYKVNVN